MAKSQPKAASLPPSKKAGAKAKKKAKKGSKQHVDDPSRAAEHVAKNEMSIKKKMKRKWKKENAKLRPKPHLDASSGVNKGPKIHQAAGAPFSGDRGQPIIID